MSGRCPLALQRHCGFESRNLLSFSSSFRLFIFLVFFYLFFFLSLFFKFCFSSNIFSKRSMRQLSFDVGNFYTSIGSQTIKKKKKKKKKKKTRHDSWSYSRRHLMNTLLGRQLLLWVKLYIGTCFNLLLQFVISRLCHVHYCTFTLA